MGSKKVPPKSVRQKRVRKSHQNVASERRRPNFSEKLGALTEALSIIATATGALSCAQDESGRIQIAEVGEHIVTLHHGVQALRRACDDMDVALRAVLP